MKFLSKQPDHGNQFLRHVAKVTTPVVAMVILLSHGISGSRGADRIFIDIELVIPIIINIKELQPYHIIYTALPSNHHHTF